MCTRPWRVPMACKSGALASEGFDGKTWQRWSRHRTPANPWRPGLDNLATHFGLVEEWFGREVRKD